MSLLPQASPPLRARVFCDNLQAYPLRDRFNYHEYNALLDNGGEKIVSMQSTLGMTTFIVSLILVTAICGCNGTFNPPSNLVKVSESPCKIQWTDNSNNEDGFNIYHGGSCANCAENKAWTKVASVGANVVTYTWDKSCCSVGECSCVMVRAYKGNTESTDSNVIMLAPVC